MNTDSSRHILKIDIYIYIIFFEKFFSTSEKIEFTVPKNRVREYLVKSSEISIFKDLEVWWPKYIQLTDLFKWARVDQPLGPWGWETSNL